MKLAFLAPEFVPTWGGVGIYSVNLIKELCKDKNLEIHVITPKREDYDEKRIEDMFDNKIKVHQISHASDAFVYNFKFQLAMLAKFNKLNEKYHFDLVHSANVVHMPDIFLKFKKQKIPNLVTAHTTIKGQVQGFLKGNKNFLKMAPSEKGSILVYPIISLLEKIYLKRTKNLITVSNKFAYDFIKSGYKGRVDVTHNGIVPNLFNYNKIKDPYKDFKELKKIKKPIVLFAGRLITQKGIDHLIEAMKILKDKAHFVIAGTGDIKRLKSLLKETNNHTFLGFVQNHKLPALYKIADIFVLPSYYENFPISLLEAMSMKCACIATDVGAVDEIIDNGKNGIIIKPGSSWQLSKKIQFLIDNKKQRKIFAKEGYKKVMDNFISKIMAEKTKKIYKAIAK